MKRSRAAALALACAYAGCRGPLLHLGEDDTALVRIDASTTANSGAGTNGTFQEYMATSFQPADWQYAFFQKDGPHDGGLGEREATLAHLAPHRIRVQLLDGGAIPWTGQDPDAWDFSKLDAVMDTLLDVGDVELQLAEAPNFSASSGLDPDIFGEYATRLLEYYNGVGFSAGGQPFRSKKQKGIRWWSILSDPNTKSIDASTYASLYDSVVEKMRNIDPDVRVSAPELAVSNKPQDPLPLDWLADFAGQVEQPVSAVSIHVYGTDDRNLSDAGIFQLVHAYANRMRLVAETLASSPLAGVPINVTQNNVDADAPSSDRSTECEASANNLEVAFEPDIRGTSSFFAAFRPLVYSQFGKAGVRALYHWLYTGGSCEPGSTHCDVNAPCSLETDDQNAEVAYKSGTPYLSYWVDYWLGQMFPVPVDGAAADTLLQASVLDPQSLAPADAGVEALAVTRASDAAVVIMLVDYATPNDVDENSGGVPKTLIVDVSNLLSTRPLSSASLLVLDATVDRPSLPTLRPSPLPLQPQITVHLAGYGVAFLVLS